MQAQKEEEVSEFKQRESASEKARALLEAELSEKLEKHAEHVSAKE